MHKRLGFFLWGLFLCGMMGLFVHTGYSATSSWQKGANGHVRVRLISSIDSLPPTVIEKPVFGLEFALDKGWKIYWRTPGDAGFGPSVDWSSSLNFKSAKMLWPAPHRFQILGLQTAGYKKGVVLPITIQRDNAKAPLGLSGKVSYLACDDKLCVPGDAFVALNLTKISAIPLISAQANLIGLWLAKVPKVAVQGALKLISAKVGTVQVEAVSPSLSTNAKKIMIAITLQGKRPFSKNVDIFFEGQKPGESPFETQAPSIQTKNNGKTITLFMNVKGGHVAKIAGMTVNATLVDGNKGYIVPIAFKKGVINSNNSKNAQTSVGQGSLDRTASSTFNFGLLVALLSALVGGFILNFMPCVFPVLSLKLLAFVKYSTKEKPEIRKRFLMTFLGIFVSFLVLAGILIGMKEAGASIGWGIFFQQPIFLIGLTLILVLFALNLWGLFEIRLPLFVQRLLDKHVPQAGYMGDFFTGFLATLMATPCLAPFLGTAIGFALSRGAIEIILIFSMMALGMGLPYLLVIFFPKIITFLPKPGQWMLWIKRFFGLLLFGTAIFLLVVLYWNVGKNITLMVVASVLLIITLWLARRLPQSKVGKFAGVFTIILVVMTSLTPIFMSDLIMTPVIVSQNKSHGYWQNFSPKKIDAYVQQGKIVYVDVTATWCINCKVNSLLLENDTGYQKFVHSPQVIAMQADWTKPNKAIAAYLAKYHRYGIPFNIIYGPNAPQGIVLSEMLSYGDVAKAAQQAGWSQGGAVRKGNP